MGDLSALCHISNPPATPEAFFTQVIGRLKEEFIPMNVATLDSEFGVLDRTVVYRGMCNDAIVFVTERNTRKYVNLKANPRIAMTMLITSIPNEFWQVRLIDAEAVELPDSELNRLWQEEPLFAKIRSYICECGKPSDTAALQAEHDKLLAEYKNGQHKLERTKTYCAFKMPAKIWDFYKSEPNAIADRVQYRWANGKWNILHVDA